MSTTPECLTRTAATGLGPITAPDGYYLLPEGAVLAEGDKTITLRMSWYPVPRYSIGSKVPGAWAFTYARKLPECWTEPADDRDGGWAWSTDEENYEGSYDTPEEAFIAGHADNDIRDDETVWVGRVTAPDPVRCLLAGPVIEQIRELLGDEAPDFCDSILPEPSDGQLAVLETLLRDAYRKWLTRFPDQRPDWFTISGKVLEKTGAEIRELYEPET